METANDQADIYAHVSLLVYAMKVFVSVLLSTMRMISVSAFN